MKVKAADLPISTLLDHAKELASKNNIILRLEAPNISKCKAYPTAKPPRVVTQPITSPWRYAVALHELGHILSKESFELSKTQGNQLLCEAEAWKWALERSKVEFSEPVKRRLGEALKSYHDKWEAKAKESRGTLQVVHPPADSVYWTIIGWAAPKATKARVLP